jgi:hypothetical protein
MHVSRIHLYRLLDVNHPCSVLLESAVNPSYTEKAETMLLAKFPAMTHLTLTSQGTQLEDVETLLASLHSSCLASLTLGIKMTRAPRGDGLQRIAAICASGSFVVTVRVYRMAPNARKVDMDAVVRTAFAELDGQGRLHVVVS